VNFGILPLTFINEKDYDQLDQDDELIIASIRDIISSGGDILIQNKTKGISFNTSCVLSARQRKIILAGGALNLRDTN
jgi:aconitate hydratase